eukprot:6500295-Prymnesium_polylepis.2
MALPIGNQAGPRLRSATGNRVHGKLAQAARRPVPLLALGRRREERAAERPQPVDGADLNIKKGHPGEAHVGARRQVLQLGEAHLPHTHTVISPCCAAPRRAALRHIAIVSAPAALWSSARGKPRWRRARSAG